MKQIQHPYLGKDARSESQEAKFQHPYLPMYFIKADRRYIYQVEDYPLVDTSCGVLKQVQHDRDFYDLDFKTPINTHTFSKTSLRGTKQSLYCARQHA